MRHRRSFGVLWTAVVALGFGGVGQAQQGFFTNVKPVPGVDLDSPLRDGDPFPSADGRTVYFSSVRQQGGRAWPAALDLWRATRAEIRDDAGNEVPFGKAENLGPRVNSAFADNHPSVTQDEKILCFNSNRDGGGYVYQATRDATDQPFDNVRLVLGVSADHSSISADGLTLILASNRGERVTVATRDETTAMFGDVRTLGPGVNDPPGAHAPSISADGLALFFAQQAPGPTSDGLRVATRDAVGDLFGPARRLDLPLGLWHPSPSADWPGAGSKLYFMNTHTPEPFAGNDWDLYQADWVLDCNENGEDDLEDIKNGVAQDANGNDIPDECEDEVLFPFRRGDSNADGTVNIADGVTTLGFLFAGNQAPPCLDAADTDDSGQVDIADSIGTFNYLFLGGAAPAPPGPTACGEDPTVDGLSCGVYAECP